jgi:hypothetical protein
MPKALRIQHMHDLGHYLTAHPLARLVAHTTKLSSRFIPCAARDETAELLGFMIPNRTNGIYDPEPGEWHL